MERTDRRKGDELWRRYRRTRRRDVRNRIVEKYLPLVRAMAERLAQRLPPHVEVEDLVSAGTIGLVGAVENYDPDRGVKFETYCRKRVAGAMFDELRRQDWLPREVRDRGEHLQRTIEALRERLGREPSEREVAEEMGLEVRDVRRILIDLQTATHLPLRLGEEDEESGRHVSHEPVDALPAPDEQVFREEILGLVESDLDSRERLIVRHYYHEEQTLKRIGRRLRLSESRVCQMHLKLLRRLERRLRSEVWP